MYSVFPWWLYSLLTFLWMFVQTVSHLTGVPPLSVSMYSLPFYCVWGQWYLCLPGITKICACFGEWLNSFMPCELNECFLWLYWVMDNTICTPWRILATFCMFLYENLRYWYFTIFHPRIFFSLKLWQILLFFCHGSSHTHSQISCKCKILYFNSDRCRRSLTSPSLQPEQFKPSTQSAMTDPMNHLVEAEFCMISPCEDPKIFHGSCFFT